MQSPPAKPGQDGRVRIAEAGAKAVQSRAHKQFNSLIKKLEAERARLAGWKAAIPSLQQMTEQELRPLVRVVGTHRRQMLLLLDQAFGHRLLGKREKEKVASLICVLAEDFLDSEDDDEVSAIYEKYSDDSELEDDDDEDESALFKAMLEEMLGGPLGDDIDTSSPEALHAALRSKLAEETQRVEQAAQERDAKRKKPAKLSAREERAQAEAQRLKQSVRDIYRKLASALHPDRETDKAEHARKTSLMQRVNVAYAANDLLGLLELQLEVEQLDQAGLDSMDEERILQFNKILNGQLAELKHENDELEFGLLVDFSMPMYTKMTPQEMISILHERKQEMQAEVDQLTQDLVAFQDIKQLKAWLKTYKIPPPDFYYDDGWL
jgi:hypothetical protein